MPARTRKPLVASSSSAMPGQSISRPLSLFFSITSLAASAAVIIIGRPELWPSPWPGPPSTMGFSCGLPGSWLRPGSASTSLPMAMSGPPVPQLAVHAVGMPAMPRVMVKPFFSRMPVRYSAVRTSWKPGSAKLNSESTISCVSLARASTPAIAAFLSAGLAAAKAGALPASSKAAMACFMMMFPPEQSWPTMLADDDPRQQHRRGRGATKSP